MGKTGVLVLAAALLLTGCSSPQEDMDQHFSVGETISTAWFDYTVTQAERTTEYQGYISAEGEQLVVVEMTLKSTYSQPVTMYDSDFQLFWPGIDGGDVRCMPVEYYCDSQFPLEYELKAREICSGVLVYQVPQEETEFQLVFQELFDDGTQQGRQGERYVVDVPVGE